MRRTTSILTVLGLVLCLGVLAGCSGSGGDSDKSSDTTSETTDG